MIWTYNRLKEQAREWALQNKHPLAERCVKVIGGKKMAKSGIDSIAGNGTFGFSTRRGKTDGVPVKLTKGLDGQWKSGRGSVAKRKKNVCRMATSEEIKRMQMDKVDIQELVQKEAQLIAMEKEIERQERKQNRRAKRNHRARRMYKKGKR